MEEPEKINFYVYDWSVKTFKTRPGFGLYGDIPVQHAKEASILFVESQRPGYALKITAEIVKVSDEGF